MSVVVRAGMLRPDDWFVVGATCGKVRTLSPLQAGSGQAAVARGLKEFVNEASSGMAVRVSVAWKNDKDMGNGFDVGDSLHVLSPADALHIARYRAHRDTFLLLRTPWEEAQRSRLMRVPLLKDRKRLLQLRMRCLDGSGRLLPAGSTDATHDELAAVWVAELDKAASAMVPQEEEDFSEHDPRTAAVIKASSAGEMQALLEFLRPRAMALSQVQVVSHGVGNLRDLDLKLAEAASGQGLPCRIYLLNVSASQAQLKEAKSNGTPVREHQLFHDLLADVLDQAGLEGPVRELADMRDDGSLIHPSLAFAERHLRLHS